MMAPPTVAMGMVNTSGSPRDLLRMAAVYPPTPIKKAPPRETNPTKWAKKSNPRVSRTYIPTMVITLFQ
jgi:hypothetical protein